MPNSIILKTPLFNYTIDGFLRYEFIVGIAYEVNSTEAIRVIFETVNNVEGVLKGDKKPAIIINELAISTINIRVMFWVDSFKTTKRYVHLSIRSKVMNDVVAVLISKGLIMLQGFVVETKIIDSSTPLSPKNVTNDDGIAKP